MKMSNKRRAPCDQEEDDAWHVWRATKKRAASGDYSDLIIECGEDNHKVHKLVMSASRFFERACSGPFKEAQEGIIRLPHDDPTSVKAMIDYLYHGCYGHDMLQVSLKGDCASNCSCKRPKQQSELVQLSSDSEDGANPSENSDGDSSGDSDDSSDSSASDSDDSGGSSSEEEDNAIQKAPMKKRAVRFASPLQGQSKEAKQDIKETKEALACFDLPLDAMVYALGEKYDLPGMKKLALETFQDTIKDTPRHVVSGPFHDAAIIVFESTPDTDSDLRKVVVEAITTFKYASDCPELRLLLEEVPSLSLEVSIGLFSLTNALRSRVNRLETQQIQAAKASALATQAEAKPKSVRPSIRRKPV